ncbi:Transcription elongation factor SPT4 homolog 2, partial [Linum perenne]
AAQIPTSYGHELRACLRCHLVKTSDQFRDSGCENCPFFKMDEDQDRIGDCTTNNFNGYDPIKEVTGQISVVVDDRRNWSSSTVNINFRWWKTLFLGRFQVRPISVWLFGLS